LPEVSWDVSTAPPEKNAGFGDPVV